MSNLEVKAAVASIEDVVSEYGENGEFWGEDEVAEAFRDLLPDVLTLLDFVNDLL